MAKAQTPLADSAEQPPVGGADAAEKSNLDSFNAKVAKGFMERILDLEEQMDTLKDQRKEIYDEAEEAGYSPKWMRGAVKEIRKPVKFEDKEGVNCYLKAAGHQGDLFAIPTKH